MRWIGSHGGLPVRRLAGSLPIQSYKIPLNCSLAESWTSASSPPLGHAEMLADNHFDQKIKDKVDRFPRDQPFKANSNHMKAFLRQSMQQQIPSLPDQGISRAPSLLTGSSMGGMVAPTGGMERAKTGEQVRICFRMHAPLVPNANITPNSFVCDWFAIPRQQVANDDYANDFLSPIFHEPPMLLGGIEYIPVVVGHCIFIIGGAEHAPSEKCASDRYGHCLCGIWFRRVHYLDTQSVEKRWEEAPTLEKAPRSCYAFAVDGKIYLLGTYDRNSFSLQYLDCHELKDGWKSLLCSSDVPQHNHHLEVIAHTIEYEIVNDSYDDAPPKRRARRVIMVAHDGLIYYDFETNEIEFYEDRICPWPHYSISGVSYNGAVYYLAGDCDTDFQIMVYDLEKCARCSLPVIGFEECDKALPKIDRGEDIEGGKFCAVLLHLGKERFCLLWLDSWTSNSSKIRCTQFKMNVIQGQHRAEEISTQAYRLRGYLTYAYFTALTI